MTNHHHHQRTSRAPDRQGAADGAGSRSAHSRTGSTPAFATRPASADFQRGGELTAATIGAIIGVTRQTLYHWRDNGIPWWRADAAAIRAGAHPLEIWADFHTHTRPTGTGEVAA